MGVRLKVKLKSGKRELTTVALANAGYESEEPELILPQKVAERLEIWPKLPEGSTVEIYEVAGGHKVESFFIPQKIEVQVISGKEVSEVRKATPVIMREEREVILSDQLISAFRIDLVDVGKGLWRFRDEEKVRRSEEPEYW